MATSLQRRDREPPYVGCYITKLFSAGRETFGPASLIGLRPSQTISAGSRINQLCDFPIFRINDRNLFA